MNKSLLTLGIILSLGTVGCAGFGVQSGSSLASSHRAERGVDALWTQSESTPQPGAEPAHYAEQSLGTLWDTGSGAASGAIERPSSSARAGDLWNSASVTYTWAPSEGDADPKPVRLFGKRDRPARY